MYCNAIRRNLTESKQKGKIFERVAKFSGTIKGDRIAKLMKDSKSTVICVRCIYGVDGAVYSTATYSSHQITVPGAVQ